MIVTKINYFPINRVKESQPLARCSVVLDNCLKLNDIKIFVGKDGRYIVFPDRADLAKYSCECQNTLSKNKGNECFHPVGRVLRGIKRNYTRWIRSFRKRWRVCL